MHVFLEREMLEPERRKMPYSELDKRIMPVLLLVMIAAVATLAFLLRHQSEQIRAIPTAVVALLLLFIEVVKQRWNLINLPARKKKACR